MRHLEELHDNGWEKVSSAQLGAQLGLTPSQIRQDLSCFGAFGQHGYGYDITQLSGALKTILGENAKLNAILLGAGNIGKALLCNFCFEQCGICMKAAFDINPEYVSTKIFGVGIYDAKELENYVKNNRVDIAVLCLPKAAAEENAALLKQLGVEAFWNFTNTELFPPESDAIIENVHFSDSLLALSYMLTERKEKNVEPNKRLCG